MKYEQIQNKNEGRYYYEYCIICSDVLPVYKYKWYLILGQGKYTGQRVLQVSVDGLLFLVMLGVMISGIGMSHYVFHFLNFDRSMTLARNMHMICSYAWLIRKNIKVI